LSGEVRKQGGEIAGSGAGSEPIGETGDGGEGVCVSRAGFEDAARSGEHVAAAFVIELGAFGGRGEGDEAGGGGLGAAELDF